MASKKKFVAFTTMDHDSLHCCGGSEVPVSLRVPSRVPKSVEYRSDVYELGENDPNICQVCIYDEGVWITPLFKGTFEEFKNALRDLYNYDYENYPGCGVVVPTEEHNFGLVGMIDEEITYNEANMGSGDGDKFVEEYIDWIRDTSVDCDSSWAIAIVDLNKKEVCEKGWIQVDFD